MLKYVLITPARNEAEFIRKTLESVTTQTVVPEKWVIVDDGSTDPTADIIKDFQQRFDWIELIQQPPRSNRNFAGKADAVNLAYKSLDSIEFHVVGNLDADVSFEPGYMEFLMTKFQADPKLGVAGTPFTQDGGYDSTRDSFEGANYVAGPCQLFRLECWKDIGGYVANKAGGVDWIAVMDARMKGWTVTAFPEKRFHHYRSMGTAEKGAVGAMYDYGERAYYLGGSFIWHLFRVFYRSFRKPYLIGAISLLSGYVAAAVRRVERPVSKEMIKFHRRDQMKRLRLVLKSLIMFRKMDSFGKAHKAK